MITEKDYLHCEGKKILNRNDKTVYLRGTNLGGWLLQEEWMAAVKNADSQWTILHTLEDRFGYEKARKLIDVFEDHFITENDLDILKNAGFNCLRVPFWYGNFQSDDNGTPIKNSEGKTDFRRLDWVADECAKRDMYIILDMHGVPGHQSIAHHSCRNNHCRLYDETPEGENFRNLAAELWSEIAEHFCGNPVVASYDLMNEPMCDYTGKDKVNKKYWNVYDLIYKAIREKDPDHIITLEAIWTPLDIPHPSKYGWTNVMYEYHLYEGNNAEYAAFVPFEKVRKFNVPVFIGEFAICRGKADWESVLKIFNKAGYHWTTWTYKGFCRDGGKSEWFIKCGNNLDNFVDILNDDYESIEEKWKTTLDTEGNYIDMNTLELFGKYAKEQ